MAAGLMYRNYDFATRERHKEIKLSFPRAYSAVVKPLATKAGKRESRARRNISLGGLARRVWIPIFMGMTEKEITL
jgi:hypothetical protein